MICVNSAFKDLSIFCLRLSVCDPARVRARAFLFACACVRATKTFTFKNYYRPLPGLKILRFVDPALEGASGVARRVPEPFKRLAFQHVLFCSACCVYLLPA